MKELLDKLADFTLRMDGYVLQTIYGEQKGKYLWQVYKDFRADWFRWWLYLDEKNRALLADYIAAEGKVMEKQNVAVIFGLETCGAMRKNDWDEVVSGVENYNGTIISRTFSTKAEKDAYIKGLDDSDGWCDYYVMDAKEIDAHCSDIDYLTSL